MAAFKKGQSGNPKGRPRGAKNKATVAIQQFARSVLESPRYRQLMLRRASKAQLTNMETQLLHFYAFGRPRYDISADVDMTPRERSVSVWVQILSQLPPDVQDKIADLARQAKTS
jgi:hypothetical protein